MTWPTATPWPCWVAPRHPPSRALSLSLKIRSALKRGWAPTQHRRPSPRDPGRAAHRAARRPAAVAAAFGATTRATVGIIAELNRQISRARDRAGRHILRHTRTPTSTAPCQDLVSSSAPGCSVSSGTTRTATPRQVSQKLRRNLTTDRRVGQETRRAGPPRPQPPPLRRHRPMGLLRPHHQPRRPRLLRPAPRRRRHPPPSPTRPGQPPRRHPPRLPTPPHPYDEHTAWAHRHTHAPLDNLRPWDV